MIYFIHGDAKQCFKKAGDLARQILIKKPESEIFKLNSDNWQNEKLDEFIGGKSLFAKKYIVQISRALENDLAVEKILGALSEIRDSENIFIWVEPDVDAKTLLQIKKYAEKIQECKNVGSVGNNGRAGNAGRPENAGRTGNVGRPNNSGRAGNGAGQNPKIFALTDALGERDSKKMWLLYLEIQKKLSPAPEEIHGILWWQIKSMILASRTKSAGDAGLKPFVYSKSKRYAKNYSPAELENLADEMVKIYHESRLGGADLATRIEGFILNL